MSWDNVRSTAVPYTESRLTRSVANERVGFPVVEHVLSPNSYTLIYFQYQSVYFSAAKYVDQSGEYIITLRPMNLEIGTEAMQFPEK